MTGPGELALACERFGDGLGGWLGQPANTVTSVAFVVAGVAIVLARRGGLSPAHRAWYAVLVTAVGIGSVIQHGPHPPWQAYAHDLPLATVLAFVAADAAADLSGRRWLSWAWLPVPGVMVLAVAAGADASVAVQAALAVLAIGLGLWRAARRPTLRRTILVALALLAAGALVGSVTDRTSLCQPDSLLQGHAAWHVLSALALWWLAPVIGARGGTDRPTEVSVQPAAETPRRAGRKARGRRAAPDH